MPLPYPHRGPLWSNESALLYMRRHWLDPLPANWHIKHLSEAASLLFLSLVLSLSSSLTFISDTADWAISVIFPYFPVMINSFICTFYIFFGLSTGSTLTHCSNIQDTRCICLKGWRDTIARLRWPEPLTYELRVITGDEEHRSSRLSCGLGLELVSKIGFQLPVVRESPWCFLTRS